jgi:hypothetical protein
MTIKLKWILGKLLENVNKWVKPVFMNTLINLQILKPPSQVKKQEMFTPAEEMSKQEISGSAE